MSRILNQIVILRKGLNKMHTAIIDWLLTSSGGRFESLSRNSERPSDSSPA